MTAGRSIRLSVIGVVAFVVVAVAVFARLMGYAGVSLAPAGTYDVRAVVPTAVNLIPHADVREAGITVGQVPRIQIVGDHAVLWLAIEKRYAPVHTDATVLIRDKSLAGENYVSLDPGSQAAPVMRDNGELPITQAPESTQIDQILANFTPQRRRNIQHILGALGIGLNGEGTNLNELIDGVTASTRSSVPVAQVIAADRQQAATLIDDFGQVAQGLATRGAALQELSHDAPTFSSAVAARGGALERTLRALPGFIDEAHHSVDQLGGFSRDAVPVLGTMRQAMVALVPAVDHLAGASNATRRAVDQLTAFAPRATRLVAELGKFSPVAGRLMGPLESMMRQSNPGLAYLDRYADFLGWALTNTAAYGDYTDAKSYLLRGIIMYGADSVSNVTPSERAAVNALLAAGVIQPLAGDTHYNPYPSATPADILKPWSGTYPRLYEDPPYRTRSSR